MSAVRPLTIDDAVDAMLSPIATEDCRAEIAEALRLTANLLLREAVPGDRRVGEFATEELAATEASVARGDLRELESRTLLKAIAASFSESEAAERLRVSRDRVRELYSAEQLFGFNAGAIRSIPDGSSPTLGRMVRCLTSHIYSANFCPMNAIVRTCKRL